MVYFLQPHQKFPQPLTLMINIFLILKFLEWFCNQITVFVWFFITFHLLCRTKATVTERKQDCSFLSSVKRCKGYSDIDDSVKKYLQKDILSHPHIIQSPIADFFVQVNLDDRNGVNKKESHQKCILQVLVCELYTYILKKDDTGFSMTYDAI